MADLREEDGPEKREEEEEEEDAPDREVMIGRMGGLRRSGQVDELRTEPCMATSARYLPYRSGKPVRVKFLFFGLCRGSKVEWNDQVWIVSTFAAVAIQPGLDLPCRLPASLDSPPPSSPPPPPPSPPAATFLGSVRRRLSSASSVRLHDPAQPPAYFPSQPAGRHGAITQERRPAATKLPSSSKGDIEVYVALMAGRKGGTSEKVTRLYE